MRREKRKQKKVVNITFSLPKDITSDLRALIKPGCMSQFVAKAIQCALGEKKKQLMQEYSEANSDPGQLRGKEEWECTAGDGLD